MLSREEKDILLDVFSPQEITEYLIDGGYLTPSELIDALELELEESIENIMELAGIRLGWKPEEGGFSHDM